MRRKYRQDEVEQRMTGRIYVNTDDLNIFVRRKGVLSWTMNLGNMWTWVIVGVVILLVAVMLLA